METTEFLIIGAGPAGSAAGIALRSGGEECVLVDKARFPRVKLCGGLFTGKSQGVLRELLGEEAYGECMGRCVTNTERKFSLWRTDERGRRMLVEVEPRREIVLIDRPRFDEWMVRRYEAMGGRMIEGDGVASIDFTHHVVYLSSGREIAYGTLIAADGANGGVERMLMEHRGLLEGGRTFYNTYPRWDATRGNSLCVEVNVEREDCPDAEGVQIHFGVVPRSYAWSFAKGDKVCLGLVQLNGVEMHIRQVFRQFLAAVGVRHAERYPLRGAMIPFGNYMPHPAYHPHGVLFVGDAARLVEPLTGEGIFYALQSGVYAARSGGDTTQYIRDVSRLQRLIDKGGQYQRWLMGSPFHSLMCRHAHKHPGFIEHFYSTQIEQACLDHFPKIVWRYERGKGKEQDGLRRC